MFAEKFFNELASGKHGAVSAGTILSGEEVSLEELLPKSQFIIDSMKELGFDVSRHVRRQVTSEMVEKADVVVNMADSDSTPDFVKEHPELIVWDVEDPKGTDFDFHRKIRDEVKSKVEQFIEDIKN